MLQIAIIEDEADLAQQTKVNAVRYLNEHGLEGNIAVFNDGMDIATHIERRGIIMNSATWMCRRIIMT